MEKRSINGYEAFLRANFLYQAALEVYWKNSKLAQFYIYEMRQVCEKMVLRM